MAKIELDLAGVLNYLAANPSKSQLWGADWAANMAWPAINGHGIQAATLTTTGRPMLSLVAALNAKAGTTNQALNAVCNTLAGTKNLEADLALRVYAGIA